VHGVLAHVIDDECVQNVPRGVAASFHDECIRVDNPYGVKGLQDCRLCASTIGVQITPWGHHPTTPWKINQNCGKMKNRKFGNYQNMCLQSVFFTLCGFF
jgi:hypothetical protein